MPFLQHKAKAGGGEEAESNGTEWKLCPIGDGISGGFLSRDDVQSSVSERSSS